LTFRMISLGSSGKWKRQSKAQPASLD
jgi:hypothetical protein